MLRAGRWISATKARTTEVRSDGARLARTAAFPRVGTECEFAVYGSMRNVMSYRAELRQKITNTSTMSPFLKGSWRLIAFRRSILA
jgi:hypothetical protein